MLDDRGFSAFLREHCSIYRQSVTHMAQPNELERLHVIGRFIFSEYFVEVTGIDTNGGILICIIYTI